MQTLFVPLKILLVAVAVLFSGICIAQERTTNGTKVILAVNKKTDAVEHIVLLINFQEMGKKELADKYRHHNFFLGLLKGSYSPNKNRVVPGNNTTVIIYTDKQFFPHGEFFQGDDFAPGDEFNLGDTKAKIIANTKGELIIKTQKP